MSILPTFLLHGIYISNGVCMCKPLVCYIIMCCIICLCNQGWHVIIHNLELIQAPIILLWRGWVVVVAHQSSQRFNQYTTTTTHPCTHSYTHTQSHIYCSVSYCSAAQTNTHTYVLDTFIPLLFMLLPNYYNYYALLLGAFTHTHTYM